MNRIKRRISDRAAWMSIGFIVLLAAATSAAGIGENMNVTSDKPSMKYEIPFEGPGQLATIWSTGPNSPYDGVLVISTSKGSRRLKFQDPFRVRWGSRTDLIVDQSFLPMKGRFGERLVRIDREGELLGVLSDRQGLTGPVPSPDGRWLALERLSESGFAGLEIRDLSDDFRLVAFHPNSSAFHLIGGGVAWNQTGTQLVVGSWVEAPEHSGTLYPRLTLIARDDPNTLKRIADGPAGIDTEVGGVVPLFWKEGGIYGRSNRGLLRCDPQGSGCEAVYGPGKDRFIVAGTVLGPTQALLLVQDPRINPLEVRAREIHQVDLTTGKGMILLRLPDGTFINDIDWIGDPIS